MIKSISTRLDYKHCNSFSSQVNPIDSGIHYQLISIAKLRIATITKSYLTNEIVGYAFRKQISNLSRDVNQQVD